MSEPTPDNLVDYIMNEMKKPILFAQWIAETRKLQTEFYGIDYNNLTLEYLEQYIMLNAYAATEELHEATAEISWKPWAKSQFFNREAFLGEMVDVLHFVGNMIAAANVTDAELDKAYYEKMERNRERQRTGYTGLDKCVECARAIDDVIAHGGRVDRYRDERGPICGECEDKL